ncbi:hypothetical protein GUITHDRAFT_100762 [Guillardia theta CCMP2712]|uniref:SUI1 domain-containing protein n=1 Tax=Guillardia theta (strain CCMP2712) TaxID=905079 RepID=L1JZM8_GUITC|nr:hypothetical protein GUITHDRAFT_100762 [Guillardia theta CCMP2712]EKX53792.1 hypothetical protein GUITHDRAFT_100762 [Guillardia theta CCMP2712]|eukprot:XP_005840772.1 hypothetical protein GUITHDRAFT_100762 [Guillardia theta CCMP2712]
MFKKPVKQASSNPLGGKETKKLRGDILKKFDISEGVLDSFFSAKDKLNIVKLSEPHPQALAPVSKFVVNGADLMLPGVAVGVEGCVVRTPEDLPDFDKGDLMLIYCVGNPMPFAIGDMLMSKKDAISSGMKGKCMRVLHTYRDSLWESGSSLAPPGFLSAPADSGAWVEPVEGGGDPSSAAGLTQGEEKKEDKNDKAEKKQEEAAMEKKMETLAVDSPANEKSKGNAWGSLSPDDMAYAMLLCAIKTRIQPSDLPCETSKFLANFMQPVLPEGMKLDFKQTSYKQLGKFLTAMEKKKILKCKKVFGQECVSEVNKEHKDVVAYEPVEESGGGGGADARSSSKSSKPSIIEGFKPNNNLVPILGGTKDTFYTEEQVVDRIKAYGDANKLLEDGKIKVDECMISNLYVKFKEEERPALGSFITIEKCLDHMKQQMTDWHSVEIDGQQHIKKGKPQKVKTVSITVEDRQGGRKAATIIRNLESMSIDPDAFAKLVQKKFSTSASVAPLPGKNETRVETHTLSRQVNLQGNLLHDMEEFLQKEYKVTQDFIILTDKTKK